MLRKAVLLLALLSVLMPAGLIEKTGAYQFDVEDVLQTGSFSPPVKGPIR
ncbi:MAG: hypothetical protein HY314_04625 [Acidobacteria bacterium]|nr:hypothetical protein [Acidobacteriota bacterium]